MRGLGSNHENIIKILQQPFVKLKVTIYFVFAGKISALVMVPHADGCMVHVCYNSKSSSAYSAW